VKPKTMLIDIDGTICTEEATFERPLAKPLAGARERLNRWYQEGHTIILWTARGWEQYRVTVKWLEEHGFRFHQLLMGKPIVDVFIDDRAYRFEGWDAPYFEDRSGE
jgi:uncharacterized HAD superfamily protein